MFAVPSAILVIIVVLALFIVMGAIKIVPQGYEYTVQRFGRFTRTLKPGLTFLMPFYEGIGKRINMMAKAMGKCSLTPSEESLLVEMMASKATVECHAEQLAGALQDIKDIAENPLAPINKERFKRVEAAFSACPSAKEEP